MECRGLAGAAATVRDRIDSILHDYVVEIYQILPVHVADVPAEVSKKEMDDLGMFASILGHIGDGNFHESIMYDKRSAADVARIEKCVHDMVDRALDMEGTCTGEHGVGLGKKEYLAKELGPGTIAVMQSIKHALDPR